MDTTSHKPITSFMHGIMDYGGAVVLFFAPNIFGFASLGGPAVAIPRIVAAIVLVQSLMTNYEWGVVKKVSMRTHLINDYVVSLFLAASPWLFGFYILPPKAWVPHLIVGLAVFAASTLTEPFARQDRPASLSH